jgi:hypothetical protein
VEEIYEDEVPAVVIHGDDIDGLEGWQWDQSKSSSGLARYYSKLYLVFSKQEIVFARTTPKHKLEIGMHTHDTLSSTSLTLCVPLLVKRAQALGHIVGV